MEFEIKYQDLRRRSPTELRELAEDLGIPNASISSADLDGLAKMVAYNLRSDELAAAREEEGQASAAPPPLRRPPRFASYDDALAWAGELDRQEQERQLERLREQGHSKAGASAPAAADLAPDLAEGLLSAQVRVRKAEDAPPEAAAGSGGRDLTDDPFAEREYRGYGTEDEGPLGRALNSVADVFFSDDLTPQQASRERTSAYPAYETESLDDSADEVANAIEREGERQNAAITSRITSAAERLFIGALTLGGSEAEAGAPPPSQPGGTAERAAAEDARYERPPRRQRWRRRIANSAALFDDERVQKAMERVRNPRSALGRITATGAASVACAFGRRALRVADWAGGGYIPGEVVAATSLIAALASRKGFVGLGITLIAFRLIVVAIYGERRRRNA